MSSAHPLTSLVKRAAPITGKELYHLPDLGPCELVEGQIQPMSPTNWRHAELVTELASRLRDFVRSRNRGVVLSGEVGIYTARDPDTVRGAEVAVLSTSKRLDIQSESFLDVAPDRVVEVLSPGNREEDITAKIEEYFRIGVGQIWIVDPKRRTLSRHRAPDQVEQLKHEDTLRGEGLLEGFELPLSELAGTG